MSYSNHHSRKPITIFLNVVIIHAEVIGVVARILPSQEASKVELVAFELKDSKLQILL